VRGIRILCNYLTVVGFLRKEVSRYRGLPVDAAAKLVEVPSVLEWHRQLGLALRNPRLWAVLTGGR
jgi:hypothetical protein